MNRIAKFEKVSFKQFKKDFIDCFDGKRTTYNDAYIKSIYDNIKLPERKTKHSGGYDFHTPISFTLPFGENIIIPTGIKARIDEGWVLKEYVRSSIGFKYGVSLANGTGIIDGDYYNNKDNEGHIFIKLSNNDKTFKKALTIFNGDAFCQGIFVPYGITVDDNATDIREGGIGSTNNKR